MVKVTIVTSLAFLHLALLSVGLPVPNQHCKRAIDLAALAVGGTMFGVGLGCTVRAITTHMPLHQPNATNHDVEDDVHQPLLQPPIHDAAGLIL
ncbi:hypothetical protein AX14_012960 [Amanita brunnescens Koide BX004]|nr:hypothetical protein AX14_012960 [Amanita brunnescens Koide BX004]